MNRKWLVWGITGAVLYLLTLKVMWLIYLVSTKMFAMGLILNPWDDITWSKKYLEFFPAYLLFERGFPFSVWADFLINCLFWGVYFILANVIVEKVAKYVAKKK